MSSTFMKKSDKCCVVSSFLTCATRTTEAICVPGNIKRRFSAIDRNCCAWMGKTCPLPDTLAASGRRLSVGPIRSENDWGQEPHDGQARGPGESRYDRVYAPTRLRQLRLFDSEYNRQMF